MSEDQPLPIVSKEEGDFIKKNGGIHFRWISGMLISIRENNRTIEEDFQDAISDKDNSEHSSSFKTARDFLVKHAGHFNIK